MNRMPQTRDWASVLAGALMFVLLGLIGLGLAGLVTGALLFLLIFAVGLAVVGAVGFALASVLRFAARNRGRNDREPLDYGYRVTIVRDGRRWSGRPPMPRR